MSRKSELNNIRDTYIQVLNEELGDLPVSSEVEHAVDTPQQLPIPFISISQPHKSEGCDTEDEVRRMAKSDLFNILKEGSAVLDLLESGVKIEPWVFSKIVKASEHISAIKSSLDYKHFEASCSSQESDDSDLSTIHSIKNMLVGESLKVNEEVLRMVKFNIACLKESI